MKLTNTVCIESSKTPNTKIPYLGRQQEAALLKWQSPYIDIPSREVLEKVLTEVGDYKIKRFSLKTDKKSDYYFKPISLQTVDGREIKICIGYGDIDRASTIEITENGIEDIYEVLYNSGKIIINPFETNELSTGFTQHYDNRYDKFSKTEGDVKIFVDIMLPYNSDEFVFVDEEIKKQFKETKFHNIMDLYHFLIDRLPGISSTFNISTYNCNPWYGLEEIKVKNGEVTSVELLREIKGNKVKISEKFSDEQENEALDELVEQVRSLRKK